MEIEGLAHELFECLMNRIYNAEKYERLSPPSDRERRIIDAYLSRDMKDENYG